MGSLATFMCLKSKSKGLQLTYAKISFSDSIDRFGLVCYTEENFSSSIYSDVVMSSLLLFNEI